MTAAMREEWGHLQGEPPHLIEVTPQRRPPGWALLAVFPLAVALTVFAIGGANGRTPTAVRIEVRDASGDLVRAGQVADRLTAAGMRVVILRASEDGTAVQGATRATTEIRYRGDSEAGLARANAVRRAVGTGTIVRSSRVVDGVDVILVIGKDVQNE